MDWIRRNWPDLLIGIALVAVIAGIIATLLTGGSFFPLGQSNGGVERPEQARSSSVTPSVQPDRSSTRTVAITSESSRETRTGDQNTVSIEPVGERSSSASSDRPLEVAALPLTGSEQVEPAPRQSAGQESSERDGAAAVAAAAANVGAATAAPAAQTQETRSTASSATSASAGTDADGSYRVSVGAFSSAENAQRQAEKFRSAGYPVFIGAQGTLSIVLVGPYQELVEAERVAERIRAGGFDIEPVIYRFRAGDEATPATSATTRASSAGSHAAAALPASTGTSATSAQQASQASAAVQPTAAAASGGRYLQVGAYATSQGAQPQRQRLETLGYRVTERSEGNLIKLLVGPFAGEELASARGRLSREGIENFPR